MIHGPGCPVCVTPLEQVDKALAIAARPDVIFTSYGDMLRVPGSTTDLLALKARGADVRIVYSPARRPQDRPRQPRPPGRLLRRRLRDDGPGERDGRLRGGPPRDRQLQRPRQPRPRAAGDDGAPGLPEQPGPGVPGRGPRLRRHGLDGVRADRGAVPRPDRGHRLRAPRPPGGDPHGRPPARGGPRRGREPVRPGRAAGGRAAGPGADLRGLRGERAEVARGGGDPPVRVPPPGGLRPLRRRAEVRRRRDPHQRAPGLHRRADPHRREAADATAPRTARSARPSSRSARRWSAPRGPARPSSRRAGVSGPSARRCR